LSLSDNVRIAGELDSFWIQSRRGSIQLHGRTWKSP